MLNNRMSCVKYKKSFCSIHLGADGNAKKKGQCMASYVSGGRVTNAVGTIFRKIFVGICARPI